MSTLDDFAGSVGRGVIVGTVGTAVIVGTDSIVTRMPTLNSTPIYRGLVRLALAGGSAGAAAALGAPKSVIQGIVAGGVTVTLIDCLVNCIGEKKREPPAVKSPEQLGDQWAPTPLYVPAPADNTAPKVSYLPDFLGGSF